MKTKSDPRHLMRRQLVKELFADSFSTQNKSLPLTKTIIEDKDNLDSYIIEAAPEWSIEKINKIDLAVLRLGVFELLNSDKASAPPKVIIDEAVELAKEFGAETSSSFVNGVLGSVLNKISAAK